MKRRFIFIEYDAEDNIFVGEVFGVADSLNFHGTNVEELRQLKNIVLQYSTLDELVTAIDFSLNAIYYQDVPLNVRFDLNMFKELSIFTDNELKILSLHHIYNLQDLIDFDLCSGKANNFSRSFKEKIEWVRNFYNMNSFDKNAVKKQKKK